MAYTDNVAKWFELYYRADEERKLYKEIKPDTAAEFSAVSESLTDDEADTVYKIL